MASHMSEFDDLPTPCNVCKIAREQGNTTCPKCGKSTDPWAATGKRD